MTKGAPGRAADVAEPPTRGGKPRRGRSVPPRTADRRYSESVTSPQPPRATRPVEYKGEPLEAERGPGLGCFRFQLALLLVLLILTPLSVAWSWPVPVSFALLGVTLVLLLFAGQTVIFLLRLVAAERGEGRRRPRASATRTVGELEDEELTAEQAGAAAERADAVAEPIAPDVSDAPDAGPRQPGVRE